MILRAVMTFILSTIIWLSFMLFLDYVMDLMIDNLEIYYATNANLFVMVASFITIFGIVAFAIRALRDKEATF